MEAMFKQIICKYDKPLREDGSVSYKLYWDKPEHNHIDVTDHSIRFWFAREVPTTDYYEDGSKDENVTAGLEFTSNLDEEFEHCTVTIEFSNGNIAEYKCPENFSKFVEDFRDFKESNYTCVPGTSVMSKAASLLDDEMQYEI